MVAKLWMGNFCWGGLMKCWLTQPGHFVATEDRTWATFVYYDVCKTCETGNQVIFLTFFSQTCCLNYWDSQHHTTKRNFKHLQSTPFLIHEGFNLVIEDIFWACNTRPFVLLKWDNWSLGRAQKLPLFEMIEDLRNVSLSSIQQENNKQAGRGVKRLIGVQFWSLNQQKLTLLVLCFMHICVYEIVIDCFNYIGDYTMVCHNSGQMSESTFVKKIIQV